MKTDEDALNLLLELAEEHGQAVIYAVRDDAGQSTGSYRLAFGSQAVDGWADVEIEGDSTEIADRLPELLP